MAKRTPKPAQMAKLREELETLRNERQKLDDDYETAMVRVDDQSDRADRAEMRVQRLEQRLDDLQSRFVELMTETQRAVAVLTDTRAKDAETMRTLLLRLVRDPEAEAPTQR